MMGFSLFILLRQLELPLVIPDHNCLKEAPYLVHLSGLIWLQPQQVPPAWTSEWTVFPGNHG